MEKRRNFLLLSTIFCYLFLDFHVKTGTRISLRFKRLFEISEVEITRVNCIYYFHEPETSISYKIACEPSKDSDQPVHSVFSQGSKVSSGGKRRLSADYMDAQSDLSLRWAHMESHRNAVPRHMVVVVRFLNFVLGWAVVLRFFRKAWSYSFHYIFFVQSLRKHAYSNI